MKKYNLDIAYTNDNKNIDYVQMKESENGEYYKVQDIDWLFKDIGDQFQVNKLDIQENDVLVVRPPKDSKWKPEYAEKFHHFLQETFKQYGYKNLTITFLEDIDLGIARTYKSNYANGGE